MKSPGKSLSCSGERMGLIRSDGLTHADIVEEYRRHHTLHPTSFSSTQGGAGVSKKSADCGWYQAASRLFFCDK